MTPLHIKILHFLTFPEIYIKELNSHQPRNQSTSWGDLRNVWDELFKDIRSSNPMLDVAVMDLRNWGLVHISKFHEASLNSVGTSFGKEYLGFINDKT